MHGLLLLHQSTLRGSRSEELVLNRHTAADWMCVCVCGGGGGGGGS